MRKENLVLLPLKHLFTRLCAHSIRYNQLKHLMVFPEVISNPFLQLLIWHFILILQFEDFISQLHRTSSDITQKAQTETFVLTESSASLSKVQMTSGTFPVNTEVH